MCILRMSALSCALSLMHQTYEALALQIGSLPLMVEATATPGSRAISKAQNLAEDIALYRKTFHTLKAMFRPVWA